MPQDEREELERFLKKGASSGAPSSSEKNELETFLSGGAPAKPKPAPAVSPEKARKANQAYLEGLDRSRGAFDLPEAVSLVPEAPTPRPTSRRDMEITLRPDWRNIDYSAFSPEPRSGPVQGPPQPQPRKSKPGTTFKRRTPEEIVTAIADADRKIKETVADPTRASAFTPEEWSALESSAAFERRNLPISQPQQRRRTQVVGTIPRRDAVIADAPTWRDLPPAVQNLIADPLAAESLRPEVRAELVSLRAADKRAQSEFERQSDIQNAPSYPEQLANRFMRGAVGTGTSSIRGASLLHPEMEADLRAKGVLQTPEEQARLLRRTLPVDPTDESVLSKGVEALGSAVPFVGASMLGGLAGAPAYIAPAILGAASNAGQTYEEAIAAGEDPESAKRAAIVGALIGLTEGAGVGRLGGGAMVSRGVTRAAAGEFLEEGAQEGVNQALNNVNAKILSGYDPRRAIEDGVAESFLLGGFVGGTFGGSLGAASKVAERADLARETAAGAEAVRAEPFAPLDLTPTATGPTNLISLREAAKPEFRKRLEEATGRVGDGETGRVGEDAASFAPSPQSPSLPVSPADPLAAAVQQLMSLRRPTEAETKQAAKDTKTQAKEAEKQAKQASKETEKQAKQIEKEAGKQAKLDERATVEAEGELKRMRLYDESVSAAQAALDEAETLISAGDYPGAIGKLRAQQNALGQSVKYLPETPEAVKTKANIATVVEGINTRIPDLRKQALAKPAQPAVREPAQAKTGQEQSDRRRQVEVGERVAFRYREEADAARAQGDLLGAQSAYNASLQALKDALRLTPTAEFGRRTQFRNAITAVEQELRGISGELKRRPQSKPQTVVDQDAPTAELPATPLLDQVNNPEGGVPPAPESASGRFGALARRQAAQREAAPQSRRKDTGALSPVEYLKRATGGEGVRVSDRGEAQLLGAKEAGIVGLTNRSSKWTLADAQVMLEEGGFTLADGRRFTDESVTENDVLQFLQDSGKQGRLGTVGLDQRLAEEEAEFYASLPSEPLEAEQGIATTAPLAERSIAPESAAARPVQEATPARRATERLRVPKAAPENIKELSDRRSVLSRLRYDRPGELTQDLNDEYRELGSRIAEFENEQARARGGEPEDAPPLGMAIDNRRFGRPSREDMRRAFAASEARLEEEAKRAVEVLPKSDTELLERGRAAVDALFAEIDEDVDALDLLDRAIEGDADARQELIRFAERRHGVDADTVGSILDARQFGRERERGRIRQIAQARSSEGRAETIAARHGEDGEAVQTGSPAAREIPSQVLDLISLEPGELSVDDLRRYRRDLDRLKADGIRGIVAIPDWAERQLEGKIKQTSQVWDARRKKGEIGPKNEPRAAPAKPLGKVEGGRRLVEQAKKKEAESKSEETPTVVHPNPELDRKPILAETNRGTVLVPNPANKTGVSEVKDRGDEPAEHKFSSTQVNLPAEIADRIVAFGRRIPDQDLADDGRDTEPHITIKYGLHGWDPSFAQEALAGEKPAWVTFGKVSLFENDEFDVVKVEVKSDDLHRLNKKVSESQPQTETHPTYRPHATVAYVKKGRGARYVGNTFLEGQTITLDSVTFSGRDGERVEIPLGGKAAEPAKAAQSQTLARAVGDSPSDETKVKVADLGLESKMAPSRPANAVATRRNIPINDITLGRDDLSRGRMRQVQEALAEGVKPEKRGVKRAEQIDAIEVVPDPDRPGKWIVENDGNHRVALLKLQGFKGDVPVTAWESPQPKFSKISIEARKYAEGLASRWTGFANNRTAFKDLVENSRVEYRRDPGNPRAGVIYMNSHARRLYELMLSEHNNRDESFPAMAVEGDNLIAHLAMVRHFRDMARANPGVEWALTEFDQAISRAINDRVDGAIFFDTHLPGELWDWALSHESFHVWQFGAPDVSVEWVENQPGYDKIRAELLANNYEDDPVSIAREWATYAVMNDLERFGFTEEDGLQFLDAYFDEIVNQGGVDALDRIGNVAPKPREIIESKRSRREDNESRSRTTEGPGGQGRRSGTQTGPKTSKIAAGRSPAEDRVSLQGGPGGGRKRGSQAPDEREVRRDQSAEPAETGISAGRGTYLGFGLGSLQPLFNRPAPPKTTPLRQIADALGHEALKVDAASIADEAIDALAEAVSRGKAGSLPFARAAYWADKLKAKKVAGYLKNRQAQFITRATDLVQEVAKQSVAMDSAKRGSLAWEKAKRELDRARIKLSNHLAKAGEHTHPFDYAAKGYKASLLSSPHIPFFNVLAQAAQFPFHEAQKAIDFLVPSTVFNKWGIPYDKPPADITTWAPAMARELGAIASGAKSSFGDVKDMLWYGVTETGLDAEAARRLKGAETDATDKYEMGNRPKLIPGLDQAIMAVSRIQGAADIPLTNIAFATALAAEADATARKIAKDNPQLKLTKDQIKEIARDLANDPSPAMVVVAADEADRFKLDYPTWAYNALQAIRNLPVEKFAGRDVDATFKAALNFAIPFSKIPLAAVDTALFRYSPAGMVRVASRLREARAAKAKGEEFTGRYKTAEQFGRDTAELYRQSIVGTLAWTALGLLGNLGYAAFTGGGDDDKRRDVAAAREALGERYTPELVAGDTALDVGRMGPVGQAAALGARVGAAAKRRYDTERQDMESEGDRAMRVYGAAKKGVLFENPIGRAMEDLSKGEDDDFIRGKLRGAVPGALRSVARMTDETKRIPDESSFTGKLRGDIQSGLPSLRKKMQPKLDALGRPVEETSLFSFMRSLRRDAQLEEIRDLDVGLSMPRREDGESAEEYNARVRERGRQFKTTLEGLREDETMREASPDARRAVYERSLDTQAMERAGKLSSGSVRVERQIEALRGDAYAALRSIPEYGRLNAKDRKAVRDLINEELKRFGATARGVTSRGRFRREKRAQVPNWTPADLARAAVEARE